MKLRCALFGWTAAVILAVTGGCPAEKSASEAGPDCQVRLMVLDPGHFHAALVQKTMYEEVCPDVYVYAPEAGTAGVSKLD